MGKKAGWINKTANSPILFAELDLLAKQLFPTADEGELDSIVDGILQDVPANHEEAVQMLKDYYTQQKQFAKEWFNAVIKDPQIYSQVPRHIKSLPEFQKSFRAMMLDSLADEEDPNVVLERYQKMPEDIQGDLKIKSVMKVYFPNDPRFK